MLQQESLSINSNAGLRSFAIGAICFTAFVSPFLALFSGLSLSLFFIISAIIPTVVVIKNNGIKWIANSYIYKVVFAFFAVGIISTIWAIKPDETISMWLRLLVLFISGAAFIEFVKTLKNPEREIIGKFLLAGFVIALVVANIEIMNDGVLTRFFNALSFIKHKKEYIYNLTDLNRGSTYLSILFWPLFAYFVIKKQRIFAAILFVSTLFTLLRLESQSAWVAMILGAVATAFVSVSGRRGICFIMGVAFLAIPAVAITAKIMEPAKMFQVIPHIPNSASEVRLYIWDFAAEKAYEKPILGWGLNSSRSIPVKESDFVLNGRHPLPLHPHNNVLQMWLELGVFGLLLYMGFVLAILKRVKYIEAPDVPHYLDNIPLTAEKSAICRKFTKLIEKNITSALFVGLAANYFVIGEVGYGIWQSWWVSGILITVALMNITCRVRG